MYSLLLACALLGVACGYKPVRVCGLNEHYIKCGDPCPETCNAPKPLVCKKICLENGCVCKPGYVRETKTGPCIKKNKCKNRCKGKVCGKFEVRTKCDTPCQPTCENPNRTPCPTLHCNKPDCVCKKGYIRKTEGGECIPIEKCPCGPNEVMTTSGSECDSCPNQNAFKSQIALNCPISNETKCRCKQGYLRSASGTCISPEECPVDGNCEANDPNSQYYTCVPCTPYCSAWDVACPDVCISGCSCKSGFVFNENGKCVPSQSCLNPVKDT